MNGVPDFEDVKKVYADTEVDEYDLGEEAMKLRPEEISGGSGDISHYCAFVEVNGPPKVRRDVPLADGPFCLTKYQLYRAQVAVWLFVAGSRQLCISEATAGWWGRLRRTRLGTVWP